MFLLLLALWIILNGRITVEILLMGVVICAALYWFCVKFFHFSPRREWQALKLVPKGLCYIGALFLEILKSNLAMLPLIYSRKKAEPVLVTFQTPLKTNTARSILADSITVTPGTITVLMEGDTFTVHCLDRSLAEGLEDLPLQRRLLEMERITGEAQKNA